MEKLDEKVGGIPEWACHAIGIATSAGVVICIVAGALLVRNLFYNLPTKLQYVKSIAG